MSRLDFMDDDCDIEGFPIQQDDEPLFDERKCRVCGCTDYCACPGGCYWVEWDLCSACAEKMEEG